MFTWAGGSEGRWGRGCLRKQEEEDGENGEGGGEGVYMDRAKEEGGREEQGRKRRKRKRYA